MTPYEIGIMLHYYARAGDCDDMTRRPSVWKPTLDAFLKEGLLRRSEMESDQVFMITDRGKAFVEALQRVPLPIQVWVVPGQWKPLPEEVPA